MVEQLYEDMEVWKDEVDALEQVVTEAHVYVLDLCAADE